MARASRGAAAASRLAAFFAVLLAVVAVLAALVPSAALAQESAPAQAVLAAQASQAPLTKVAPTSDRDASASSFTTLWADNNANIRPSTSDLASSHEYRVYFQVEGDDAHYPLTEADGETLSADAQRLLGMTQADLNAIRAGAEGFWGEDPLLVSVERSGTNEYLATSTAHYPSGVVVTEQATDAEGNPKWEQQDGKDKLDADGNRIPVWNSKTSTKKVTYSIGHPKAGTGADAVEIEDGAFVYPDDEGEPTYKVAENAHFEGVNVPFEKECLQLAGKVTIDFKLNVGAESADYDDIADWLQAWAAQECWTVTEGSDGRVVIQKSENGQDESLVDFFTHRATLTRDESDPTRYTISVLSAMYSPDQKRLVQSLTHSQDVKTKDGYTDYYQVWYDNSSSPNHSGDTGAAFSGSTVTITHAGTTSFDATKYWQDDDPSARPATTYTLWRFSSREGASSRQAAQVQGADGNFITLTMTAEENAALGSSMKLADSNDFEYTETGEPVKYVTSYNEAKVDLGERFREKYASTQFGLAKYDPDGYPYIYFVRETMDGGDYEQAFGIVDYDGNVTDDTSPNYWDPDRAEVVTAREGTRPAYSNGVFNGGATTNVRKAQTQVSGFKTWDAAAFQDQLGDVKVTMKCQRILKKNAYQMKDGRWAAAGIPMIGQDGTWLGGNYEWQDIDITGYLELEGWTAENLTQRFSRTFPRYDEHGEEYVYRWAEVNVQRGEDEFPIFLPTEETDGGVFALEMTDENGETEYVWFAGYYDEDLGGIVNRYANSTEQHVDKFWAQVDDEGDIVYDGDDNVVWTQDEKPYGDKQVGPVKVTLVRDDEAVGDFELDGQVDEDAQPIVLPDGTPLVGGTIDWIGGTIDEAPSTVQETSPWHLDFNNLPEYAPDGHKYSYLVFEGDLEGYYSTREYDPDTRTTTLRNMPGPGKGTEVHISKSWLDGGNSTSRVAVKVGLYAARDIYFNDDGGSFLAYNKDQRIATVTLDNSNEWYAELTVPVPGLDWRSGRDLYIRELSTEDDPDKTVISEGKYRVFTKEEVSGLAAERDADEGYGVLLSSWNDPDESSCRMVTSSYAYDISYRVNDTKRSLEVVNRRVGLESVDITKAWRDAGTDVTTRPSAHFDISNEEGLVSFVYDAAGWVYARMDGMADQPLYAGDASERLVVGKGVSISDDGRHLYVNVSSQATDQPFDQATYRVRLLPKYDTLGNVLHWNVSEVLEGTSDYASSQTGRSESFGPYWHHLDQLSVSFENRRAATKDVVFHMRWYDAYVNEVLGQRPDIYLTLYARQLRYDEDGLPVYDEDGSLVYDVVPVEGYSHYEWNPTAEAGDDPLYSQYATIYGLPMYDANGGEIVYYATAATSVSDQAYKNLDYLPQWFTYGADADVEENAGWPGNWGWDKANERNWFKSASPSKLVADETLAGQEGLGDVGYMLREDGTFNFRIDNTLLVEGEKIWMNVPYGFESTELPDLSVYLVRRLAGGSYGADGAWVAGDAVAWKDLAITPGASKGDYSVRDYTQTGAEVADGQTAVAWTSDFAQVAGSNQFEYAMSSYGRNTLSGGDADARLPKYDRNGRLYEYRAYEVVDGLIQHAADGSDVPGGFDIADGTGGVSRIYTTRYGMTNSFGIENVYGSELGRLTVKKVYTGREAGDVTFPDATFSLWRYYVTSDGSKSAPVLIDTKTLASSDFTVDGATGDGTAELTFDGLPIYTPAGQYWVYFVTENAVDGYGTRVALGDVQAGSDAFGYPDFMTDGSFAGPDLAEVLPTAEGAATFCNPTSSAVGDDDTVDVTFENSYVGQDEELVAVSGQKWWFDQGNAFNTRPEPDTLGGVELKVVRTYQDGTPDASAATPDGVLTLQTDDPEAPNYLVWERPEGNIWTYTISNLEKWAPDGKTWKYTVSEVLPDGSQYRISNSRHGGTVDAAAYDSANDKPIPVTRIDNYLAGRVGFVKVWSEDAVDAWRQRPVAYFTLQARLQAVGSQGWTEWAELGDALEATAGITLAADDRAGKGDWAEAPLGGHYIVNNGTKHYTVERLAGDSTAATVTNGSDFYNDMPLTVFGQDGTAYEVEYRVVESRLVYDKKGGKVVVDLPSPDDDGTYAGVSGAYTPSQVTVPGNRNVTGNVKTLTTVTNMLESVSVEVTKTWDDESNAWGTRPGTDGPGQAWQVTYLVQRTTTPDDADSWTWLSSYGATVASPFKDASGTLDANLQVRTVGGAGDTASVTFADLPARDPEGTAYSYRAVEVVRGAYDVADGQEVARSADGSVRLVTVAPATGEGGVLSSQSFVNKLQTVTLKGTKQWVDWGSGLAAGLDPQASGISLVLERTCEPDGANPAWEKVYKTADGAKATVQPAWEKRQDGSWAFAYEGLPKVDQSGKSYTYRAYEETGSVAGYFPLTGDGASTMPGDSDDVQVNADITNVATRFTFDKVGDATTGSDREQLAGVRFEVLDASGAVVATWERDAQGNVASYTGDVKMEDDASGYIVGLPAGTYTVHEATIPAGHVRVADFRVCISAKGEVSLADAASGSYVTLARMGGTAEDAQTVILTVTDPVTRGSVTLTKVHMHGKEKVPVAGMTFDLYAGTFDASAENGGGVRIATDLVTDAVGAWSSMAAGTSLAWENADAAFGHLGKYFATAADGLPAGDYYLIETGESAATAKPSTLADAAFPFTVEENGTAQPVPVSIEACNAEFGAAVSLTKLDSETDLPIDGARFELDYRPLGSGVDDPAVEFGGLESGRAYTFGNDMDPAAVSSERAAQGTLSFAGLKKGSYALYETDNLGYDLGASGRMLVCEFTLGDEDDAGTFDLADEVDRNEVDARLGDAAWTEAGLANSPLHGRAALMKVDVRDAAKPLDGVAFKLQVKVPGEQGDQWENVTGDGATCTLLTGQSYTLEVGEDGSITGCSADAQNQAVPGQLLVGNLPQGTYRFVEVASADGYAANAGDAAYSGEFVIEPATFAGLTDQGAADAMAPVSAGTMTNAPTGLTIQKRAEGSGDAAGAPLPGAEFTVEPAGADDRFVDGAAVKTLVTDTEGMAQPAGTTDEERASNELVGQLVVGCSYRITETKAPEGYAIASASGQASVVVTVQADGSLAMGEAAAGWSLAEGTAAVTVVDKETRLQLSKVDENGDPLPGAVFVMRAVGKDAEFADGDTEKTLKLDGENASAISSGLLVAGCEYAVREVSAPAGYTRIQTELRFKVSDDGFSISAVGDVPEGWEVGSDGLSVVAHDTPARLALEKRSTDGTLLAGATFEVTGLFRDAATGEAVQDTRSFTTGADGRAVVEGLVVAGSLPSGSEADGCYVVRETVAPAGYKAEEGVAHIRVASDGSVVLEDAAGSDSQASGAYTLLADEAGLACLALADEPIALAFDKVDAIDAADGVEPAHLEGARFTLTGAFVNEDGTLAEETYENQTLADLAGRRFVQGQVYGLTETSAPLGYALIAGTFEFKVGADGTLTQVSAPDAVANGAYEIAESGVVVTAFDLPVRLTLVKAGADASGEVKPLAGAEFTVTPAEGSLFADGTTGPVQVRTGQDGAAHVDALLVAGCSYQIEETLPPDGYIASAGVLDVTVATDGSLSLVGDGLPEGWTMDADDDDTASTGVVVVDEPTSFYLAKTGDDGSQASAMEGAQFTVKPVEGSRFADQTDEEAQAGITLTLDHNGRASLERRLVAGCSYTVKETRAPSAWYKPIEGALGFTVGSDGTVSLNGDVEGYTLDADGVTLHAVDEYVAEGDLTLAGVKTLDGRAWQEGDAFSFTVVNAADTAGQSEVVSSGSAGFADGDASEAAHSFEFGTIHYTRANLNQDVRDGCASYEETSKTWTLHCVVTEEDPGLAGVSKADPVALTVKVVDRCNGTLEAAAYIEMDGELVPVGTEDAPIGFTNVYTAKPVTASPTALKAVVASDGNAFELLGGEFAFTLNAWRAPDGSAPIPSQTVRNDARGAVAFDKLTFDVPGVYVFSLWENTPGTDTETTLTPEQREAFTYDGNSYWIYYTVADDTHKGELYVQSVMARSSAGDETHPELDTDQGLEFTNSYNPGVASVSLEATKAIENVDATSRVPAEGEFSFELVAGGNTAGVDTPMPEGSEEVEGRVVKSAVNGAADIESGIAHVAFGAISYDRPGAYNYTVREVPGDDATVSYSQAVYGVTVAVSDTGGRLVAEVAYTLDGAAVEGAAFTNVYAPVPTAARIEAVKRLDGNRATPLAAGEFSFTLAPLGATLAADGTELAAADMPMPEGASVPEGGEAPVLTVTNAADGSVDFGDVAFNRAGTYRYELREVCPAGGLAGGVTYDAQPREVTVTVAEAAGGGHGLTASVSYDGAVTPSVFVNVYEDVASSVTGPVSVTKELSGRALNDGEFSFELRYAGDSADDLEGDLDQVKANDAQGRVTFDEVTFLAPGTYAFELAELGPDGGFGSGGVSEGVTYDVCVYRLTATVDHGPDGAYRVAWNVLDDAGMKVNAEKIVFSNSYVAVTDASTQVVVQATKFLHGRQFDASQVALPDEPQVPGASEGQGGAGEAGQGPADGEGTGGDGGEVTPGGAASGDGSQGDSAGMPDGSADDQPAETPSEGEDAGADDPNPDDEAQAPDADGGVSAPEGDGAVDGSEEPDFAAEASPESDADAQAAPAAWATEASADGETGFPAVLSTMASDLTAGVARLVSPVSAYADDAAVEPEPEPEPEPAPTDSAEAGVSDASASERPAADPASDSEAYAVRVAQLMDEARNEARTADRAMEAGEFSFFIYLTADPSCIVASAVNGAAEPGQGADVTFSPMGYTTAYIEGDPTSLPWLVEMGYAGKTVGEDGCPVYTVAYTAVEDTSWLPASVTSNVPSLAFTVTVRDDLKGNLTAQATYPAGGMVFENSYDSAVLTVAGSKALTGGAPLSEGEFSFNLSAVDGGPLPAATTAANDASGTVSFGQILFDEATTGLTEEGSRTFTYCVTENPASVPGVACDTEAKYFTVTVTRAADGTLSLRTDPAAAAPFSFVNVYTPTPAASSLTDQLGVTKSLAGRTLADGEFAFDLYALDDEGVRGDEPVASGANAADGTVTLSAVTFERSGVYRFELVERAGDLPGVGYDRHVARVTATVSDDFAGAALVVKWGLEEGSTLTFENSYEPAPASVSIEASKELTGATLQEGQFAFELRDADGNLIEVARCAADGTVCFSSLTFNEVGEYAYTVREVDDGQSNVTYDAEPVRNVTVAVSDDGAGQLVATVSGDSLAFVNSYEEPAPEPTPTPKPDPTPNPQPEPSAPTTPSTPATATPSGAVPKTADDTPGLGMLAGIALAGLAAVVAGVAALLRGRRSAVR